MLEAFCTNWLFRDFSVDFLLYSLQRKNYFAEQCCLKNIICTVCLFVF